MRSTVSGLLFLTLFLVLGLALGSRRRCEEKQCVFYTKCPIFLRLNERYKAMQRAGTINTKAGKELAKTLRSMVCDQSAGKVCCPEGNINTGISAGRITVINQPGSGVSVHGDIIGFNAQTGARDVFPYGTRQAPLGPGRTANVITTFGFPTNFTAFNNNGGACNFDFVPSVQYTIIGLPRTPFCAVFPG